MLWLDMFIVTAWLLSFIDMFRAAANIMVLRLVRLVMFVFRFAKKMRHNHYTDSVLLIASSLKGSFISCLGAFAVLFMMELSVALLTTQWLECFIEKDSGLDKAVREQLWHQFGTPSRSLLTMFPLVFGEWYETSLLLKTHVNGLVWIPTLLHQFVFGFAVFAIVQGVFINETFHAVESDDEIMIRRMKRDQASHRKIIQGLFEKADFNNDGKLAREEFVDACTKDESISAWLAAMDTYMERRGRRFPRSSLVSLQLAVQFG